MDNIIFVDFQERESCELISIDGDCFLIELYRETVDREKNTLRVVTNED
jgi:hypothetical protein